MITCVLDRLENIAGKGAVSPVLQGCMNPELFGNGL